MPSHYKNEDKLRFDTFTIKMLLMTTYVITSATNNLVARCAFYKKDSESVFCKKSILPKMIQYSPLTRSPMGQKICGHKVRDRAEGGAGGALAPPPYFFARIKINLTKNNLTKVTE